MTDARSLNPHLIDGDFQSDKYPTTPRGKVPLSCKDVTAQDLLWEYAQRRRSVDEQFAEALAVALQLQGYKPYAGSYPDLDDVEQRARIATFLSTSTDGIAMRFHDAYERLAPSFGYRTREASAKPWAEVPDANKRLMIATCAEVSSWLMGGVVALVGELRRRRLTQAQLSRPPRDASLPAAVCKWCDQSMTDDRPAHALPIECITRLIARLHDAPSAVHEELSTTKAVAAEYAERINADARDCAYRDRLIEKMRAVLAKVVASDVETDHEIAFLLELPVVRKDDAYLSETDRLRTKLSEAERQIAELSAGKPELRAARPPYPYDTYDIQWIPMVGDLVAAKANMVGLFDAGGVTIAQGTRGLLRALSQDGKVATVDWSEGTTELRTEIAVASVRVVEPRAKRPGQ